MKPENKHILDAHRHFWETFKRQQTMTGVTQTVKNELLKVMHEEFQPGYTYDAWCGHCVVNFIKAVYQRYERWEKENVTPVQDAEKIVIRATFPKAKKN